MNRGFAGELHPAEMRETGPEPSVGGDELGTRPLRDRDVDHVADGPVFVPAGQFERVRVVLGHAPHREAAEQGGRAVGVGAAPPAAPDAVSRAFAVSSQSSPGASSSASARA